MARTATGLAFNFSYTAMPWLDSTGCVTSSNGFCCSQTVPIPTAQCTNASPQCPAGMSTQINLTSVFSTFSGTLYYVENPSDGNTSRYVSQDGRWDLRYDASAPGWVLRDLRTGAVWYHVGAWDCHSSFTFVSVSGVEDIHLASTYNCSTTSWNCTGGACVEVAGGGGTYGTLAACKTACLGGVVTTDCGTLAKLCTATFAGDLLGMGAVPLTWVSGFKWESAEISYCGNSNVKVILECVGGLGWRLSYGAIWTATSATLSFSSSSYGTCVGTGTATVA